MDADSAAHKKADAFGTQLSRQYSMYNLMSIRNLNEEIANLPQHTTTQAYQVKRMISMLQAQNEDKKSTVTRARVGSSEIHEEKLAKRGIASPKQTTAIFETIE